MFLKALCVRSYAPHPEEAEYNVFMKELSEVFERFAVNGSIVEKMEREIYPGNF